MDWIISFLALWSMYAIGKKKRYGWIVKMASGFAGLSLNIELRQYGLLPLAVVGAYLCVKNFRDWGKDENKNEVRPLCNN